ncbi:MAG: hypothetical protein DRH26_03670 [Deltaproteobacteria bacterium]|nr:MAG: hypothetical protein DRH26_03670 [Deltaproteobacteria bacterium]
MANDTMSIVIIYDDDGEILQTTQVPKGMEEAQGGPGRNVYIGDGNPAIHKIVDGQRVAKTQEEKDTYFMQQRTMKRPSIVGTETNEELDEKINQHFTGLIEVIQYRLENYSWLREKFYPNVMIVQDAQVKINSGISELIAQGEQQLEDYVDDCLAVKTRFPKS